MRYKKQFFISPGRAVIDTHSCIAYSISEFKEKIRSVIASESENQMQWRKRSADAKQSFPFSLSTEGELEVEYQISRSECRIGMLRDMLRFMKKD